MKLIKYIALIVVLIMVQLSNGIEFPHLPPIVCPIIQTRSVWTAANPKDINSLQTPVTYAIISHTVTPTCNDLLSCARLIRNIQRNHMLNNNWDDISYNFLISSNGDVFEGVGFDRIGAHTLHYNHKSFGIAFIGNFEVKCPTKEQLTALSKLLRCLVEIKALTDDFKLIGARQVRNTISPGDNLMNEIKKFPNWSPIV